MVGGTAIKPIAFYLPQFHPIPENDKWWGKGFTEWTNVAKAMPLYKGHWQPRLPADLGFYDLRVAESRIAQAELAKQYGVYGFAYWHYWFGEGKRLLERPFQEMLASGQPEFPFCLAWANQTWSGTWHGLSNKQVLIEQKYPGIQDHTDHFYCLLPAFQDKRYIEVNGKKLFLLFRALDILDLDAFINLWQELALKEGLGGFHFVAIHEKEKVLEKYPLDGIVQEQPYVHLLQNKLSLVDKVAFRLLKTTYTEYQRKKKKMPVRPLYDKYVDSFPQTAIGEKQYPLIYPDWDNTPRSGSDGWKFENSHPDLFYKLCLKAFAETANKAVGEKLVFIKSWNEWAEGNYLEPDRKWGHAYLEAFNNAMADFNKQIG
ncbi:MAG: glycoside hydrolase family 99-like domain-containing protein [Bacteroidetes bacterium]|nr:glycoside hydrolase family 99-like domain-containing protein [Bacteroidota bacterium]